MLQMELLFPAPLHPRLGTPPPITTISASSQGCRRDGDLDLESSQGLSFSHARSIPQSRITFQTRLLYTLLPSSLASTRSQPNHKTASLASSLGLALPTHSPPHAASSSPRRQASCLLEILHWLRHLKNQISAWPARAWDLAALTQLWSRLWSFWLSNYKHRRSSLNSSVD